MLKTKELTKETTARLDNDFLALFHGDTEDEDFEGFEGDLNLHWTEEIYPKAVLFRATKFMKESNVICSIKNLI